MRSPLSLSELVALVSDPADPDAARVTARLIQNWVTAGLVQPLARDRRGRGIHRQYGRDELCKIAVLLELNRHRLPWSVLQVVGIIFDDQHELPEKVKQTRTSAALKIQSAKHARRRAVLDKAVSGESRVFLVIKPGDGGDPTVHLTQEQSEVLKMRSATVVNLSEVLRPYR
jgi:DNA-binding transcriptional MerR regulator